MGVFDRNPKANKKPTRGGPEGVAVAKGDPAKDATPYLPQPFTGAEWSALRPGDFEKRVCRKPRENPPHPGDEVIQPDMIDVQRLEPEARIRRQREEGLALDRERAEAEGVDACDVAKRKRSASVEFLSGLDRDHGALHAKRRRQQIRAMHLVARAEAGEVSSTPDAAASKAAKLGTPATLIAYVRGTFERARQAAPDPAKYGEGEEDPQYQQDVRAHEEAQTEAEALPERSVRLHEAMRESYEQAGAAYLLEASRGAEDDDFGDLDADDFEAEQASPDPADYLADSDPVGEDEEAEAEGPPPAPRPPRKTRKED